MDRIAVFCGSGTGAHDVYNEGAVQLGRELAKRDITLVYGGANVGMMGAVANEVLKNNGEAIGVIPEQLMEREISHQHLTELYVVESMHERKGKIAELSDGFMALPGGPGTLEEFMEVFTWAQLGLHQKPCGLLNINHYYDPLMALFNHMADQQFLHSTYRSMVLMDQSPAALIDKFNAYQPADAHS